MNIIESMLLAVDSIKVNKLRTLLTLLSISIGVFAIIGAGSLVGSINGTISSEMDKLGDNSFYIYRVPKIQMGDRAWRKYRSRKPITFSNVKEFKKKIQSVDLICTYSTSAGFALKYGNNETNQDVTIVGTDENYFIASNVLVDQGRQFSQADIDFDREVCVIGNDIVVKLFPNQDPLGKSIKIKNQHLTVIGVLPVKGAVMGQSQDNYILIPITNFLKYYASEWDESLSMILKARNKEMLPASMDEAIGVMRAIRNDKPGADNSFEIENNDSIGDQFASLTSYLTWFGFICGGMALIAAGVGIMNIMLVSVKERTKEIGIRKAVGAKNSWILLQFIIETITLCQIGGIIGIIMGVIVGGLFGKLVGMSLTIPWLWILGSLTICTLLGLVSGAYPAWKAAKLDPIDALRYE